MERWQNRVAVVTGASSGIGAVVTKELIKAGLRVVALARRKHRLDELRTTLPEQMRENLYSIQCDVSDMQAVNEAFDWIEQHLSGVDILINNAGTFTSGQVLQMDIELIQNTWQTNVMGMIYCTRCAFNTMRRHNIENAHVFLINSYIGHNIISVPPGTKPPFNMYGLAKQATVALTEILRQEFREYQTKIKITSISPGVVDTEMLAENTKTLPKLFPEDIASAVMYCMSTPPHVQIHELIIKPVGELF